MKATTVGDKTVYGKIAGELQQEDDRESPLKVKLGDLANGISKFGYIGGIAIAVALLIHRIVLAEATSEHILQQVPQASSPTCWTHLFLR